MDDDESDAVGESGSAATGGSAGERSEAGAKSPSKRSGGSEDENDEAGAQSPSKRAGDSEGDRSEVGAKSPSKLSGGSEDEHDEAGTQSPSEGEKPTTRYKLLNVGKNYDATSIRAQCPRPHGMRFCSVAALALSIDSLVDQ